MRQESFATISVIDPAIDHARISRTAPDVLIKYARCRDLKLLDPYIKPGQRPTIYHVKEVPHSRWESYVKELGDSNIAEQYRRALLAGLVRIENLYQRDGTYLPKWDPTREDGLIPEESLVRIAPQQREEIGAVIWYHSFLDPRINDFCRLPRTSHAVLIDLLTNLHVDANQNSADLSREKASSGLEASHSTPAATASTNSTSDDGSASRTDATAQESAATAA